MAKNILCINFKGGTGKTAMSSTASSYISNCKLIEMDTINQSDSKINSKNYYESEQFDFLSELDDKFFIFEKMLRTSDKNLVIDVGANKLSIFHKAMILNDLYSKINLFIVPAMDGSDDFNVAMDFLESLKEHVDLKDKVIFAFNRFNEHEYSDVKSQFEQFFTNSEIILKKYGVDLTNENNYFAIKDSLAIKYARRNNITLKELCDKDLIQLSNQIDNLSVDDENLMQLIKQKNIIKNALNLQKNYILPAINKIIKKLG
jgi:hemerythrin-like domain-containing protein